MEDTHAEGFSAVDEMFYQDLFPDLQYATKQKIIEHWNLIGRDRDVPKSAEHLLSRAGFKNFKWVNDVFRFESYKSLNADIERIIRNHSVALSHFVLIGMGEGRQINEIRDFDPEFYAEYHSGLSTFSKSELYFHWLDTGYEKNLDSSAKVFFRRLGTDLLRLPEGFSGHRYTASNPGVGLTFASRWHAFEHFFEVGMLAGLTTGLDPTIEAAILREVGKAYRRKGDHTRAIAAFHRSVILDGSVGWVFEELGNSNFDIGRYFDAVQAYTSASSLGVRNSWIKLNTSKSLLKLGHGHAAVKTAEETSLEYPGWFAAKANLRDMIVQRFEALMGRAHGTALDGQKKDALAFAQAAAEFTFSANPPSDGLISNNSVGKKIRILALVNDHLHQCYYYRVLQKQKQFANSDSVEYVAYSMDKVEEFVSGLWRADIALFYRVPAIPDISAAIAYARSLGLPTIYEIDDLIFEQDHYPPSHSSYGGLINEGEYAGLLTGTPLFKTAMANCDYGIASTPSLACHMRKVVRTGHCYVHRNALGDSLLQRGFRQNIHPAKNNDKVTIFYGSGTKAHNSDFESLAAPALERLLNKHANVEIVIVGYLKVPDGLKTFGSRVRQFPILADHEVYWSLLREAHINIAVLEPSEMNDCKSEIKWLEAAVLGVPSVVSDTKTYREISQESEVMLVAENVGQWFERLEQLVIDEGLRRKIASNALSFAHRHYSLDTMEAGLSNWLGTVISERTSRPVLRDAKKPRPKTKILVVNVFFPPQTIGGATRVVRDNVDILIDQYSDEFDLSIFTTYEGHPFPYQVDKYSYRGIPVTRVSTPQEMDMEWRWRNDKIGEIFRENLELYAPDIVHFHCIQRLTDSVVDATRNAGLPYIVTVHDAWWISDFQFLVDDKGRCRLPLRSNIWSAINENRPVDMSLRRLLDLRISLESAGSVLAVSDSFAEIYREAGIDNIEPVPNGLSRIEWLPRKPSLTGRVRLGHIGGMASHKGFHLVRNALRSGRFENLELIMVDHAQQSGYVSEDVWGSTKVRIVGKVPQEEVARLYAELDVLIAPSTWPESYGLVVREALAAGLWAVVSNLGALSEPIEEAVNGFVIDVSNAKPLYDIFGKINSTPGKFLRSPKQISRWTSPDSQVEKIAEIYRRISSGSNLLSDDVLPRRLTFAGV
ncbi:MAG: glycosyltransferase [Aurantimonas endophytica]|uniref:glycosyltransferase n=1 Tax=Aurantimonas endophytica TaxID=1522175 RepID=UPI0030018DFB